MEIKFSFATTGGAGASAGSATSTQIVRGYIECVVLDLTGQPATADVTLSEDGGRTLWTRANSAADGTIYPMAQATDTAGAAITGVYTKIYVDGVKLTLAIAQGDDHATAMVGRVIVLPA
jgi:hypothetical protein